MHLECSTIGRWSLPAFIACQIKSVTIINGRYIPNVFSSQSNTYIMRHCYQYPHPPTIHFSSPSPVQLDWADASSIIHAAKLELLLVSLFLSSHQGQQEKHFAARINIKDIIPNMMFQCFFFHVLRWSKNKSIKCSETSNTLSSLFCFV